MNKEKWSKRFFIETKEDRLDMISSLFQGTSIKCAESISFPSSDWRKLGIKITSISVIEYRSKSKYTTQCYRFTAVDSRGRIIRGLYDFILKKGYIQYRK